MKDIHKGKAKIWCDRIESSNERTQIYAGKFFKRVQE